MRNRGGCLACEIQRRVRRDEWVHQDRGTTCRQYTHTSLLDALAGLLRPVGRTTRRFHSPFGPLIVAPADGGLLQVGFQHGLLAICQRGKFCVYCMLPSSFRAPVLLAWRLRLAEPLRSYRFVPDRSRCPFANSGLRLSCALPRTPGRVAAASSVLLFELRAACVLTLHVAPFQVPALRSLYRHHFGTPEFFA